MDERWYIRIITSEGRSVLWHKAGKAHGLAPELGPVWLLHFKPALFQVLPDGHIVAYGSDPKAVDIIRVERAIEPAP